MLKYLFMVGISLVVIALGCGTNSAADLPEGYHHKDLSEQMDALSIAQGAVGDAIRRNNLDEAEWAYNHLDSILVLMTKTVNNHQNLKKPFTYYYKSKMNTPLVKIKQGIKANDTAKAYSGYQMLVARCNSCHNDHGVLERAHEF